MARTNWVTMLAGLLCLVSVAAGADDIWGRGNSVSNVQGGVPAPGGAPAPGHAPGGGQADTPTSGHTLGTDPKCIAGYNCIDHNAGGTGTGREYRGAGAGSGFGREYRGGGAGAGASGGQTPKERRDSLRRELGQQGK